MENENFDIESGPMPGDGKNQQKKQENTSDERDPMALPEDYSNVEVNADTETSTSTHQGVITYGAPVQGKVQSKSKVKRKSPLNEDQRNRKIILGCFGALIVGLIIFVFISIFMLSQLSSGNAGIAQAFGLTPAALQGSLVTLLNFIFILLAFGSFIFTMIGIFSAASSKKAENKKRKKGLFMSLISGLILILSVFFILFVNIAYQNPVGSDATDEVIVTIPEDTLNLTAPAEIVFDATGAQVDSRNYDILSYQWDFDNGDTATGAKVTYTFVDKGDDEDGIFNVTLKITAKNKTTGDIEVAEESRVVSIANIIAAAIFTADPETGAAPLTVKFDASDSVDEDGEIVSYEWDFDEDGNYDDAEGVEVEHTFDEIGSYIVSLRTTDRNGEFATFDKEIEVNEGNEPIVKIDITNGSASNLESGIDYTFNGTSTDSPIGNRLVKFEWDFGDGSGKVEGKAVTHKFQSSGTYDVTLTVTDEEDLEAEKTLEVTVSGPSQKPVAIISSTPEAVAGLIAGKAPLEVSFDASNSTDPDDNISEYRWDFDGDGFNDASSSRETHTFTNPGNYKTTLTVTDADGNTSKTSINIIVEEVGISPTLTANPIAGNIPLTVNFDASGSTYPEGQIVSYKWDFGDGTDQTIGNAQISHQYTSIGTFTATVTVVASDGKESSTQVIINTQPIALSACFEASQTTGSAPLIVSLNSNCSGGTISKYLWNFAGLGTSRERNTSFTFDDPGTYTVTLEVTDNSNNIDTFSQTITVTE